ncbi:MAG TPA: AraC family transcriptional regulator [Polyangiaceae bacterium]|nr:AraC family transcriptional regulator [Polyangiaceae bacterium]
MRAGAQRRFELGDATLLLVIDGHGVSTGGGRTVKLEPDSVLVGTVELSAASDMVLLSMETSSSAFRSFALEVQRAASARDRHLPRNAADARISKAMTLMQSDPAKRWTVEELARAVGLSRAVFARRFSESAGITPLRHLTRLRMELAVALLRDSDASLAEIAVRVGYDSEFAFSRAFKRHHRVSPGVFRRVGTAPAGIVMRSAA